MIVSQTQNKKRIGIQIRDIEKKLFSYLFLNKVATSVQIQRDIFFKISHQALYKRLNLLIESGFLTANYHKELNGRLVYSLTKKSFEEFVIGKTSNEFRQQLQSNSVLHDLDLVDIRSKLKTFKMVDSYYSENLIKSGIDLTESDALKEFKNFNFDAILKIKKDDKTHLLALEYERSLKFSSRYQDYFKKVYSRPEVSAILYICESQKALGKIQNFEKVMIKNHWPKVFYTSLNGILAKTPVTFINLKNEKITLE